MERAAVSSHLCRQCKSVPCFDPQAPVNPLPPLLTSLQRVHPLRRITPTPRPYTLEHIILRSTSSYSIPFSPTGLLDDEIPARLNSIVSFNQEIEGTNNL